MTEDYVRQHLTNNGWIKTGQPAQWIHHLLGTLRSIPDSMVALYPDDANYLMKDKMRQNLIPIVPTTVWTSGALAGTTISTGAGLSKSTANPLPQVQDSITCDCGAVKCKTTHSHWCSVIQKGVK